MSDYIISHIKKSFGRVISAGALCLALSSCDSAIFDDEGDCKVNYRVAFIYNLNMKWADAFSNEVKSVRLYAFDKQGLLVWQDSDNSDALAADGYAMNIDLQPGDYTLLAWCGLDNNGDRAETFVVPDATVGLTTLDEMQCRLEREYEGTSAYSDKKLYHLWHGLKEVSLPNLSEEGGTYTCTLPLTKDTNHVRIILQHLSGEPVDPSDFTFTIEEENGLMAHDNTLQSDEMITYYAHNTFSGVAGTGIEDYPEYGKPGKASVTPQASRAITSVSVAIADLTIPRLTEGRKTYLTVRKNGEAENAARIPLTDYALLLKDGYGHEMTDQEYLDRQDEWSLTFFLDNQAKWISTSIIINSWKVVFNDLNFGK